MLMNIDEMQVRDAVNGGSVFPLVFKVDGEEIQTEGMSHRGYMIAHAPVTYECALRVFVECNDGQMPRLHDDHDRASFFAIWAMLRAEYADAVLAVLK